MGKHRFQRKDRENLYSASKTFTSVGIGIAESEGRLKLSEYALDFFPEYKDVACTGSEKITIKNLLQMSSGHTSCSGGLHLNTEEFFRIGIMLLQNGVYKDKQILPAHYVNRMHSELVDTICKNDAETKGGYGYQVWKCTPPNTYRADGMYGQLCVVLTDYNAVITVTSHNEIEHKDILRAMWNDILPKL